MRCNGMEWHGMKSLAPWTIKLSRTTQLLGVDRGREHAALSLYLSLVSVLFSPISPTREYVWNALFDVLAPKEIDFRSRNVRGNAGNRNRPPFHLPNLRQREKPSRYHSNLTSNSAFSLDRVQRIRAAAIFFFSFQRTRLYASRTVVRKPRPHGQRSIFQVSAKVSFCTK